MGQDIAWGFQCFMSVATFGSYESMPRFFTHEQKNKGVAVGNGARNAAAMILKHDVFMVGGCDIFMPAFGPKYQRRHYLQNETGRLSGAACVENVDR